MKSRYPRYLSAITSGGNSKTFLLALTLATIVYNVPSAKKSQLEASLACHAYIKQPSGIIYNTTNQVSEGPVGSRPNADYAPGFGVSDAAPFYQAFPGSLVEPEDYWCNNVSTCAIKNTINI